MKKRNPISTALETIQSYYTRSWNQKRFLLAGCLPTIGPLVGIYFIFRPEEDSYLLNTLIILSLLGAAGSWFVATRMSYFYSDEGCSLKNAFLHAVLPYYLPLRNLLPGSKVDSSDESENNDETNQIGM